MTSSYIDLSTILVIDCCWVGGNSQDLRFWIWRGLLLAAGLRRLAGALHAEAQQGGWRPPRGLGFEGLTCNLNELPTALRLITVN